MAAGVIKGLSRVSKSVGVTDKHLDELFGLIDDDGGGSLDEEEIAEFLVQYDLGTKEELEARSFPQFTSHTRIPARAPFKCYPISKIGRAPWLR